MFIHFGLYTDPGGIWNGRKIDRSYSEWLQASEMVPREEYRKLAGAFNPSNFRADDWIREAKNAGMRYFLITAKHHDGFCLWPTRVSDYNVMDATPFKRDMLGELAEACRSHDVKLGFYYSHWMDWDGSGGDVFYPDDVPTKDLSGSEFVHPSQDEFERYWQEKCLPQIRELMENYQPDFLWFDSWGDHTSDYVTPKRQDELIDLIRACDDSCLVNSRINFAEPSERCDYLSMMDNSFPDKSFNKPWETSGTLNHSWSYHRLDYDWKSTEQLLKYLVGNASYGGNYQLNVGPMPDGRFQKAATRRLREIGCWMDVNGESVYGTSASPLGAMPWGRITVKNDADSITYYLHLWDVTPDSEIVVDGLTEGVVSAVVLESGQPVTTSPGEHGLRVRVPEEGSGLSLPVVRVVVGQR